VHRAITAPSAGARRAEAIAVIVRDSKAQNLVVLDDWERRFAIAAGLRAGGATLEEAARAGDYALYRLR
jgi:hypothetical protein